MKIWIITFILLIGFLPAKSAEQNTEPHEIKNWTEAFGNENVKSHVYWDIEGETAFYHFVGDDGIECEGSIYDLAVDSLENGILNIRYKAKQDQAHFCIWEYEMNCQAKLYKPPGKELWHLQKVNCEFDWDSNKN